MHRINNDYMGAVGRGLVECAPTNLSLIDIRRGIPMLLRLLAQFQKLTDPGLTLKHIRDIAIARAETKSIG